MYVVDDLEFDVWCVSEAIGAVRGYKSAGDIFTTIIFLYLNPRFRALFINHIVPPDPQN